MCLSRLAIEAAARDARATACRKFWARVRARVWAQIWSLFPPRRVKRLLPTVDDAHRKLRARRAIYIHESLFTRDDH